MSRSESVDYKVLSRRIRTAKAIALILVIVLTLTIGEISENSNIPSWTSVFLGNAASSETESYDVIVHVIDVGQGDCTLVQCGDYNILIDAGENGQGREVAEYLYKIGVDQLDWIIATHPHSDHMGGIDDVIEMVGADNIMMIYIPEEYSIENTFYLSVLEAIEEYDVNVVYANEGDILRFGELTIEILHPLYGEYRTDINDLSICTLIRCGGFGVITCGDITYEVEEELIAEGHDLDADIYIANHHGSALSSSEEFISAVTPDYTVFSCGENNSYEHPHNSVLKLLKNLCIPYYRTDLNGTVVIYYLDGDIYIRTEK